MSQLSTLHHTPLFQLYQQYGARVVDFGGWALPLQFTGIVEEHETVRQHAGLFDVSHMGEILIEGKNAESFLNHLITNDITTLQVNQAQYTAMCYENGGTVDDLIVYKLEDDTFLLVINAANIDKDFTWIKQQTNRNVTVRNISNDVGQLAIQGPKALDILQQLTDLDLAKIDPFRFVQHVQLDEITNILVSRTGYTGEDGFELYVATDQVAPLWQKLLAMGKEDGLKACGLGARDTLRLEACLALYGQDLSAEISPVEAGIGFTVKTNKKDAFIGKDALLREKTNGPNRKLVGIEVVDRGIPRHGYNVYRPSDEEIGYITSGTYSPL